MMTNFRGNRYFGVVLCFGLFWIFLLYGLAHYGFCDLKRFHSSTVVHEFLESWWFRGFLRG